MFYCTSSGFSKTFRTRWTKCQAYLMFFAGHFRLSPDIFKLRMTSEQRFLQQTFFPCWTFCLAIYELFVGPFQSLLDMYGVSSEFREARICILITFTQKIKKNEPSIFCFNNCGTLKILFWIKKICIFFFFAESNWSPEWYFTSKFQHQLENPATHGAWHGTCGKKDFVNVTLNMQNDWFSWGGGGVGGNLRWIIIINLQYSD